MLIKTFCVSKLLFIDGPHITSTAPANPPSTLQASKLTAKKKKKRKKQKKQDKN